MVTASLIRPLQYSGHVKYVPNVLMMTLIRPWGQTFSHKVGPINEVLLYSRMSNKLKVCVHTVSKH